MMKIIMMISIIIITVKAMIALTIMTVIKYREGNEFNGKKIK